MPSYLQPFLAQRPRDITLSCAAGAEAGEITLFDVPSMNGWASTDSAVATAHRAEGYEVVETAVPLRTLAEICAEHVRGEIHFLKIDVEGFEGEVLKGMDLRRWRPWVLVVEATVPGSSETNHGSWEHLITPFDYAFAYFDGLNRYYVAAEHAELMASLNVQANVFDGFIPHHLDKAWKEIVALQAQSAEGWGRAAEVERAALDAQQRYELAARDAEQRHEIAALAAREQHALAVRHADLLARQGELLRQQLRDSEAHARQLELAVQAGELRGQTLEAQLHQSAAWGKDMEQRLVAMLNSTSWRITAPLRFITRRGPNSMAGIFKRKAKGAARRALRWLTSREALRRALLPLLMR
jgi:FkbM family methyltransferase